MPRLFVGENYNDAITQINERWPFYPEGVQAISRWLSAKRDTTGYKCKMNPHPEGMTVG